MEPQTSWFSYFAEPPPSLRAKQGVYPHSQIRQRMAIGLKFAYYRRGDGQSGERSGGSYSSGQNSSSGSVVHTLHAYFGSCCWKARSFDEILSKNEGFGYSDSLELRCKCCVLPVVVIDSQQSCKYQIRVESCYLFGVGSGSSFGTIAFQESF